VGLQLLTSLFIELIDAKGWGWRRSDAQLRNCSKTVYVRGTSEAFVGHDGNDHNLLPKGSPLIMRFRQLSEQNEQLP
jgi:hypothetical protein